MAASYPNAVKTFSNKSAQQTIDPEHINALQDEVNAIEDGILNGTAPLNSSNSTVASLHVTGNCTIAGTLTLTGALSSLTVSSNATIGGLTVARLQATNSTMARLSLSSAAPDTPLANTLYSNTIIKAWGVFSSQPTLIAGVNVSSLTPDGNNNIDIAFQTHMATSNYAVVWTPYVALTNINPVVVNRASSGFRLTASSRVPGAFMVVGA